MALHLQIDHLDAPHVAVMKNPPDGAQRVSESL